MCIFKNAFSNITVIIPSIVAIVISIVVTTLVDDRTCTFDDFKDDKYFKKLLNNVIFYRITDDQKHIKAI